MPQEPQIIIRQLLRYASVPSTLSLTASERVEERRLVGHVDLVRPERPVARRGVVAPDLQLDLHAGVVRSSPRAAPSGHPNPPPAANSIVSVAEKCNETVPTLCQIRAISTSSPSAPTASCAPRGRRAAARRRPIRDRVLHEVLVVSVGEVGRARVGAARLLAGEPRLEHARGEVEQIAELDRLGQVAVEDGALVLDDDAAVVAPAELRR